MKHAWESHRELIEGAARSGALAGRRAAIEAVRDEGCSDLALFGDYEVEHFGLADFDQDLASEIYGWVEEFGAMHPRRGSGKSLDDYADEALRAAWLAWSDAWNMTLSARCPDARVAGDEDEDEDEYGGLGGVDARGKHFDTKAFRLGKKLPDAVYVHVSAVPLLPDDAQDAVDKAAWIARPGDYDLIKFAKDGKKVSLLAYPGFFSEGFPALSQAWTVDLSTGESVVRNYGKSNPPILHRKETFLAPEHPKHAEFARLTAQAEAAGLFDDTHRIGMQSFWQELLRKKGLRVVGNRLVAA